jgi:hypothetical protein
VLLVLDGSTGQNAFLQTKEFTKATGWPSYPAPSSTARRAAAIVVGISDQFQRSGALHWGGEEDDRLALFDRHTFVNSLFKVGIRRNQGQIKQRPVPAEITTCRNGDYAAMNEMQTRREPAPWAWALLSSNSARPAHYFVDLNPAALRRLGIAAGKLFGEEQTYC